jgi:AbrB family looped-hinge helix DNA binding protein
MIEKKRETMETSKVTTRGRIVIPATIRRKFGFKKGTKITFTELDGRLIVQPLDRNYFFGLAGILGEEGEMLKSLVEGKTRESS